MGRTITAAPKNITANEWEKLRNALEKEFPNLVSIYRDSGNEPKKAKDVLPESCVSEGHGKVNAILRAADVPFNLTRIGKWVSGEARADRKLAFVRRC